MKSKTSLRSFLALAGSSLLVVSTVNATQFWDGGGGDADWNTPENWGGDVLPLFIDGNTSATVTINFGGANAGGTAVGNVPAAQTTANNDLTAGSIVEAISFTNNGQAGRTQAFTLQGNSIILGNGRTNEGIQSASLHSASLVPLIENVIEFDISLGTSGGAQNRLFRAGLNNNITVEGAISGSSNFGLLQDGAGILRLTNSNNSYLGFTNIANGGVLEVTSLTDGSSNSSIGASSNAAANLRFNSGFNSLLQTTLRYVGSTNANTDRAFTIYGNPSGGGPTNSAIESSGSGTLSFTSSAAVVFATTNIHRNLYLGGTNAGDNGFNLSLGDNGITGVSSLTKEGAGKWIITGSNTYTGLTTVTGGKLSISSTGTINSTSGVTIGTASTAATTEFNYNSSTALTKAVSFAAGSTGGTLSGIGTINLAVNVTAGNTLAIGNSVGVMNFGDNLEVGGTYLYELNNTLNTADLGEVAGNLTLGGILDLVQLGAYTAGDKFTLFAYDGNLSGLFKDTGGIINILDDTDFTDAGGVWRLNYNDTTAGLNGGVSTSNTYVTITAVPEPRAALLGGLGLLALLRRRRA